MHHVYYLTIYKLVFSIAAAFTAHRFFRSVSFQVLTRQINQFHYEDLGHVQKWVMVLLSLLVLYNDPFYALKDVLPFKIYYIAQAIVESTYIALQLFFWLFCVHSVASVSLAFIDL